MEKKEEGRGGKEIREKEGKRKKKREKKRRKGERKGGREGGVPDCVVHSCLSVCVCLWSLFFCAWELTVCHKSAAEVSASLPLVRDTQ